MFYIYFMRLILLALNSPYFWKKPVPDRVITPIPNNIFFLLFSIDFNSILALLLIGILFLVTQGGTGGLFGGGSASGYGNRNSYDYDNYYYNEQQFYKRSGYDNGMYIT